MNKQLRELDRKSHPPILGDALGAPLRNRRSRHAAEFGDGGGAAQRVDDVVCVHISKLSTLSLQESSKLRKVSRSVGRMETITLEDRLRAVQDALGKDTQVALCRASGASSSVVNQWFTGGIKSIHPRYAFPIQHETGISAEWLILGTGPMMLREGMIEVTPEEMELLAVLRQLPDIYKTALAMDARKYRELARTPPGEEVTADIHVPVTRAAH